MIASKMSLATEVPNWTAALFAALFWLAQHSLRRFVRLWAFITLPATILHELAHGVLGFLLAAQPSSFNLWPQRLGQGAWRLGYVAFQRLRWWNGGAIALAPLLWLLLFAALAQTAPIFPASISIQTSIFLGVAVVWLGIAVAPSRSDWTLALGYWFSAIVFLCLWSFCLYLLIGRW